METLEGEYAPSPWAWVANQIAEYEASNGKRAATLGHTNMPVVIVTMRGHKSGKIRKIALMRVEHEGEYALIASQGGAPKHPLWHYNLQADPENVLLQDGPEPFPVRVRQVTGAERDLWFERAVAVFPPYAEYQAKTTREIPVYVATRR